MDTIFALATAPGRAGLAVVRVSGPQAAAVCQAMTGEDALPRQAQLCSVSGRSGAVIDTGLNIFFAGPASFTGEDVLELHLHGSMAVVKAVLSELSAFKDCRAAEAGEFTKRALQNGKIDLTQVEGLADLLEAETEVQRKQAQSVVSGKFGEFVATVRADLLRATALIEAVIDFADEDVPEDVSGEVFELIERVRRELTTQIEGHSASERVREGFTIAIVGEPNVGKSTLLNYMAGRDAAITSEVAGTTRDVIEVQMDLRGIPVTMLDTAGLRDTSDPVELIGVQRTRNRALQADLRVFLTHDGDAGGYDVSDGDIVLRAKNDVGRGCDGGISGKTGLGVDKLIDQLVTTLECRIAKAGLATRARHVREFEQAVSCLTEAERVSRLGPDCYDLCAEELRTAGRFLDRTVGKVNVEDLLGEIFASFCVGK